MCEAGSLTLSARKPAKGFEIARGLNSSVLKVPRLGPSSVGFSSVTHIFPSHKSNPNKAAPGEPQFP